MQARYCPPLVLAPSHSHSHFRRAPKPHSPYTIPPSAVNRVHPLHFFHAQTTTTVKRLRLAAAGNRVESGEANQQRCSEHSRSQQFTLLAAVFDTFRRKLPTESLPNMIARYTCALRMLRSLVFAPGVHGSSV